MDVLRTVSASLQTNLDEELDELARECKVVVRERVFTGRTLLLMIVVTLLHKPDATSCSTSARTFRSPSGCPSSR